ncbi:hypothetical protein MA16_Dca008115 [Dendrobium catenatum]|uniref:Uncharacterized protein n=1 Tax=Dendrobium catenatum TaxID=906689 RepID=A0A2I0WD16_9ASPA|nr:hypothetical protein MA16_Dca008115 [Dendrobium catenatum]
MRDRIPRDRFRENLKQHSPILINIDPVILEEETVGGLEKVTRMQNNRGMIRTRRVLNGVVRVREIDKPALIHQDSIQLNMDRVINALIIPSIIATNRMQVHQTIEKNTVIKIFKGLKSERSTTKLLGGESTAIEVPHNSPGNIINGCSLSKRVPQGFSIRHAIRSIDHRELYKRLIIHSDQTRNQLGSDNGRGEHQLG